MASVSKVDLVETEALTADKTGSSKVLEPHFVDFVGWLNVSANDGSTTVDVTIQHSADNSNWEDVDSFTSVVNTTATEALQITANLLPYVRAFVDLTGTPSATVAVALYYRSDR